jgi:hypothetical protein
MPIDSATLRYGIEIKTFPGGTKAVAKSKGGDYDNPHNESVADTIDDLLEWDLVPPTVVRVAPSGAEVSYQEWIEDARLLASLPGGFDDWMKSIVAMNPENHLRLLRMAVFDWIINNRDRHSGNIVIDKDGKIWAIDHGYSFLINVDYGRGGGYGGGLPLSYLISNNKGKIPASIMKDLRDLEEGDLRAALSALDHGDETRAAIEATVNRWKLLLERGHIHQQREG